ncbi:MAG: hypothetical protein DMF91_03545 [Acidobacteria bacterium]|nr:MAG: hypothetical protein DMF91_03545 [Acidobacteriota bacterium]
MVAFWRAWFAHNSDAVFEAEDVIVSGDRAVVRWCIASSATASPGTSAAWTCSPCAMEKWPRSSPM